MRVGLDLVVVDSRGVQDFVEDEQKIQRCGKLRLGCTISIQAVYSNPSKFL